MNAPTPTLATVELQLAGWTVSHNNGAKVAFFIDEAELEPFRRITARAGKTAGQRLMAVFVLIDDQEQPVATEKAKGGPLSILAAQWCNDARFRAWLGFSGADDAAEDAAAFVRATCGVQSRADIDNNPEAKQRFNELIREPYRAHLQELGE